MYFFETPHLHKPEEEAEISRARSVPFRDGHAFTFCVYHCTREQNAALHPPQKFGLFLGRACSFKVTLRGAAVLGRSPPPLFKAQVWLKQGLLEEVEPPERMNTFFPTNLACRLTEDEFNFSRLPTCTNQKRNKQSAFGAVSRWTRLYVLCVPLYT